MIIDRNELSLVRNLYHEKTIGYCSGVFDIFHEGHLELLKFCKATCNMLVVGISDDKSTKKYKGESRPIYSEEMRLNIVNSIKYVNFAFLTNNPDIEDLATIFNDLKPNYYYIETNTFEKDRRYDIAKKYDVHIIPKPRYDKISTTKIIELCSDTSDYFITLEDHIKQQQQ